MRCARLRHYDEICSISVAARAWMPAASRTSRDLCVQLTGRSTSYVRNLGPPARPGAYPRANFATMWIAVVAGSFGIGGVVLGVLLEPVKAIFARGVRAMSAPRGARG